MTQHRLEIRSIAEYEDRPLRWLWPGRIPRGKITVLSGDPNLGKSFVTLDLAARVSAARPWPDEDAAVSDQQSAVSRKAAHRASTPALRSPHSALSPPGRVLLLSAEDDVSDTIRPRLQAAGADLRYVHVLEGLRDDDRNRGFVALHRDCDTLADLLRRHGDWALIVIDPVSAYFEGLDPNSNADVRVLLGRLADLAEQTGAALLLVSHHRKGGYTGPAIHRTIGSLAFAAVARSVFNIVRDPADHDRRLLIPVKMNLAPSPTALAFRIVSATPPSDGSPTRERGTDTNPKRERGTSDGSPTRERGAPPLTSDLRSLTSDSPAPGVIQWEPFPIEILADDATENAFADTDRVDRLRIAERWLSRQLADGRLPSSELKRRARRAGIGRNSLWEAKKSLKVTAVKQGDPLRWYWVSQAELNMSGIEPEDIPGFFGLRQALERQLERRKSRKQNNAAG